MIAYLFYNSYSVFPQLYRFFLLKNENIGATSLINGEISVYDSCFTGSLTPSVELQISQVYRPLIRSNWLIVYVEPLQQQERRNNCRVFSIAAAYHTAMKDDVSTRVFAEDKMRSHLVRCFEKGKLSRFPCTKKITSRHLEDQHEKKL